MLSDVSLCDGGQDQSSQAFFSLLAEGPSRSFTPGIRIEALRMIALTERMRSLTL